jgi:hypothetical protein
MDPPRAALPAVPNGPKEWLCGIDGYGRCWLRVSELSATRSGPVRSTSVLQEWEKWILVGIVAGLLQVRPPVRLLPQSTVGTVFAMRRSLRSSSARAARRGVLGVGPPRLGVIPLGLGES